MSEFGLSVFILDVFFSAIILVVALFLYALLKMVWPYWQQSMGIKVTFLKIRLLTKQEALKVVDGEIQQQKRRKERINQEDKIWEKVRADTK